MNRDTIIILVFTIVSIFGLLITIFILNNKESYYYECTYDYSTTIEVDNYYIKDGIVVLVIDDETKVFVEPNDLLICKQVIEGDN